MKAEIARWRAGKTIWPKTLRASQASSSADSGSGPRGGIHHRFSGLGDWRLDQGSPLQQVIRSLLEVMIAGAAYLRAGDEYGVPTGFYRTGAKCFSQSTLDLVPCYSVADALAHHEAKAASIEAVGQIAYYQKPVRSTAAIAVNLGNAQALSQPGALLHDRGKC